MKKYTGKVSKSVKTTQAAAYHSLPSKSSPAQKRENRKVQNKKALQREKESDGESVNPVKPAESEDVTLETLKEQPPIGERTDQEMLNDLERVEKLLKIISAKVETTDEIAAYFPLLKARFRLTDIYFSMEGERLGIDVKINPNLYFTDFSNNTITIQDTNTNLNDPKYTTKTLNVNGNSDTVGTSMEVKILTPYHPQGSGPKSSAQSNIFDKIPTKGKVPKGERSGDSIYIKGHLLNDNLGGPGEEKNLFPITHQANVDHERNIESDAKDIVNSHGYWAYYKVEVQNDTISNKTAPSGLKGVDADYVCTLAPLSLQSDGNLRRKAIKTATIHSKYKGAVNPGIYESQWSTDSTDLSQHGFTQEANFDPSKVLWAPSRSRGKDVQLTEEAKDWLGSFSDKEDFKKAMLEIQNIAQDRAELAYTISQQGRDLTKVKRAKGEETAVINLINKHVETTNLNELAEVKLKAQAIVDKSKSNIFTNKEFEYGLLLSNIATETVATQISKILEFTKNNSDLLGKLDEFKAKFNAIDNTGELWKKHLAQATLVAQQQGETPALKYLEDKVEEEKKIKQKLQIINALETEMQALLKWDRPLDWNQSMEKLQSYYNYLEKLYTQFEEELNEVGWEDGHKNIQQERFLGYTSYQSSLSDGQLQLGYEEGLNPRKDPIRVEDYNEAVTIRQNNEYRAGYNAYFHNTFKIDDVNHYYMKGYYAAREDHRRQLEQYKY